VEDEELVPDNFDAEGLTLQWSWSWPCVRELLALNAWLACFCPKGNPVPMRGTGLKGSQAVTRRSPGFSQSTRQAGRPRSRYLAICWSGKRSTQVERVIADIIRKQRTTAYLRMPPVKK